MKSLFDWLFDLKIPPSDRHIVVATIATTLLITIDYYHKFTFHKAIDRFIIYLIIPIIIITIIEKRKLKEYGFQIGDWRAGLAWTILIIIAAIPLLYFVTKNNSPMQSYYFGFRPQIPLLIFLDLIGWEFTFRGWLLFSYERRFGGHALWLQAVPFALAHLGKPEIETISTIFGGFLFGLVAWRSKSFIYPFLIHWFIGTFVILVASNII